MIYLDSLIHIYSNGTSIGQHDELVKVGMDWWFKLSHHSAAGLNAKQFVADKIVNAENYEHKKGSKVHPVESVLEKKKKKEWVIIISF